MKLVGRCILISILAIFLIITFFLSWTIIPTGYTGVRSTFGQISENAAADAEVARTQAEAKAAAKLIEAEAESKANQMVSDSITDTILRRMYYERWNGVLPKVVTNDSNIIVPMNEME